MDSHRGLATIAFLKARFDAGDDHLGMFQPFVEDAIRSSQNDSIELTTVQDAIRASTGLYIPTDIIKTLLRRATKAGLLTRAGGRFLRIPSDDNSSEFQSEMHALELANRKLATNLRQFAAGRGYSFASDDDALAMLMQFLDVHHIGIVLGQSVQAGFLSSVDRREHAVAAFVATTIEGGGPNSAILEDIVKGLIVQNALLLRDIPISARHLADLTVFIDSGVLLQALGYAGSAELQATTEALGLIRAAGARLRAFAGTVTEVESILRVYQDRLGSSSRVKSLRATPLTYHFLSIRATPAEIRQEIALLPKNLNKLGIRVQDFPGHVKDYTEDERGLADALKDHKKGPDADEARIWHDVMAIAGILTLRAGNRPTGMTNAKYVFASGSGSTVKSAVRWYRQSYSHGLEPIVHFRSITNAAWFLRPADASNVPMHALVGVCAAVLQPSPRVWSGFVAHLNDLVTAGELSDDESIAVVASEFTRLELSDIEPDADVEATTVREIVQRVRTEEQAHFGAIVQRERHRREESERETAAARLELAVMKGGVRERAEDLAAAVSNAIFGAVFLVLTVGAFLTIPSQWSDATRVHQAGSILWWLCVVAFVVCSVLGFTRRFQVLNLRDRLKSWVARYVERAMLSERGRGGRILDI